MYYDVIDAIDEARGLKRFIKKLGKGAILFFITLLLFEGAFRLYVIDFYGYVIDDLNKDFKRAETNEDLLLIGDSFTAFKEGYAAYLNDHLTSHNVYNASVSGTNIREQYLFGKHRLKQLSPDVLIFQYYVGNDLFSWDHPVNWSGVSVARNLYWQVSEHFWSLTYLNQRLTSLRGLYRAQDVSIVPDFVSKEFSVELYSDRDKIYFKTEPALVENSAYLKSSREAHFDVYLKRMQRLFDEVNSDSRIFILIIPHASQVNQNYYDRTIQLGAVFSEDFEVGAQDTPLTRHLQSFFQEDSRVKLLNPIAFLKTQEEMGIRTYFNNDSHLSFEGQRLIGEYLLQNIQESAGID